MAGGGLLGWCTAQRSVPQRWCMVSRWPTPRAAVHLLAAGVVDKGRHWAASGRPLACTARPGNTTRTHSPPYTASAAQVLQRCGMTSVPEVGSVEEYLARGPGFIFLFHPALGPLWDVVAQKIRGGSMAQVGRLLWLYVYTSCVWSILAAAALAAAALALNDARL